MSYADIRDEIKLIIEAVPGIGRVHDYRRHTTTWGKIYRDHSKDDRLNNWEITRLAVAEDLSAAQSSGGLEPTYTDIHSVLILGHMALNDDKATEKAFGFFVIPNFFSTHLPRS